MRAVQALPEGYEAGERVDLQHDKATAVRVNVLSFLLAVPPALLMFLLRPEGSAFWEAENSSRLLKLAVMLLGYVVYIVLHELTHAAVMKLTGGGKVRFGFTGMYAYAGSEGDWFDRSAYVCIALAPLVVWGVIFAVMQAVISPDWYWIVGLWQLGNISGAAGDIYVTVKTLRSPADVLVRDTGLEMGYWQRNA